MNPARLESFITAYAEGLRMAASMHPHYYALHEDDTAESYAVRGALRVYDIMERKGVGGVDVSQPGFRNACRALKIENSERALNNYLEVQ